MFGIEQSNPIQSASTLFLNTTTFFKTLTTMRASTALALLPSLAIAAPTAASAMEKRLDTWGGAVSLGPTKSTIINA